ncbi:MAG: sigma-70 family RNA polymerase sigma factor [Xanthomonadales bacterium]|nr:sigma-70 family RNA polymerase sigma factor [Xanthomonadales bacterium]
MHWGRIVALLANLLKDIGLAEDAMQDAFESALVHWKKNGIPQNPQAWLFTTAKHKALDKLRRAQNYHLKQQQYQHLLDTKSSSEISEEDYSIPDERLRLIFTCCHPALDSSTAVALTLRLLGGLTTSEIAKAYLLRTDTMAQRLVRGKRKIKQASVPYIIPEKTEFSGRLDSVLTVLYLIFNAGYSATSRDTAQRQELCQEALRLTQILLRLCAEESEVKGLLALMLLHDSRQAARFSQQGEYIPLELQKRSLWGQQQQDKGLQLVQSALKQGQIGSYQLQAAISAIHAEAEDYSSTNWHEIILVYDELLKANPTNVVRLNRLVAVSQVESPMKVIKELNQLESSLKKLPTILCCKGRFIS